MRSPLETLKHYWYRLVGAPEPNLGGGAPDPLLVDAAAEGSQPPAAVKFDPRYPQS